MVWSPRLFAFGRAVLFCFSLSLFAEGERESEKRVFSTLPQAKKLVLSVVEGTLGSSDGVCPEVESTRSKYFARYSIDVANDPIASLFQWSIGVPAEARCQRESRLSSDVNGTPESRL